MSTGHARMTQGKGRISLFSTAVSTVVLMQWVFCKPYIFTKQPKIARQCTPQTETSGGKWQYQAVQMESEIARLAAW